MVLPQPFQFSTAFATDLPIPGGRFPRLLFECVQDVDCIPARGNVKHPMRPADVDPDLPDARSDSWHRLPIGRVESLLDTAQLETGQSSGQIRKGPQVPT